MKNADGSKKLSLSKQTLKNLSVKSNLKTGLVVGVAATPACMGNGGPINPTCHPPCLVG